MKALEEQDHVFLRYIYKKQEGVEAALEIMEDYHITMDQFKEHFMDLNDNEKMKNKYKNLDTKFKTLFTNIRSNQS